MTPGSYLEAPAACDKAGFIEGEGEGLRGQVQGPWAAEEQDPATGGGCQGGAGRPQDPGVGWAVRVWGVGLTSDGVLQAAGGKASVE